MHVDAEDVRPTTLLERGRASVATLFGGLLATLGVHVGVPVMGALVVALLAVVTDEPEDEDVSTLEEREVVEAEFVELGKKPDPNKLPNRDVPIKSTAPPDDPVPTKNAKTRERRDAGPPPPPDAEEDLMRRLGDRAQEFAEIAKKREQEGNPEGIEEGTAEEAKAGDIYNGKLKMFFQRGWSVPTIVSDEERQTLVTEVDIQIGESRAVGSASIRSESDNPLFDQSVLDHLAELRNKGRKVPEPPQEVADQYLGRTIGIRFHGRNAESE